MYLIAPTFTNVTTFTNVPTFSELLQPPPPKEHCLGTLEYIVKGVRQATSDGITSDVETSDSRTIMGWY